MPQRPEHGNRSLEATAVAAGPQPTSNQRVVVTVTVGVGRRVVPGVTSAQQWQADENWPFSGHCTAAKVGTAMGEMVSLPAGVVVVLMAVLVGKVTTGWRDVVYLETVVVTVLCFVLVSNHK